MFNHIMVGTNDVEKARLFYNAVLGTLGFEGEPIRDVKDGVTRLFWRHEGNSFCVSEPIDGAPATPANGGTIGFKCSSPEQVKAFHDAGVAHGGTSIEDPPGPRATSFGDVHLSYVRDPDGNKLCGMYRPRKSG